MTRAAIEKNRITAVVLLVVLVAGLDAYRKMPRAEDPGFIIRAAQVTTYFPGASPERIEQLVTDKLEKAIQEIPELDFVASQSKTGVSVITVNIQERYRVLHPIWDSLRRKVDRVRPSLPDGVIGPTVNDEFGDVFGTLVTLTGEGFSYAELKEVADDVRDELLRIPDTAKVQIHGAQEERIFVEYNTARLAELGLSPVQLQAILDSRNIIIPGGDVTTGAERIAIVMAVMLLTLGLRTGLIVSSLIPMAIIMALLVMSVFGIGLDQLSLASLIIALGMLVDNAIVMSESIMVQRGQGKSALDAAIDSADELKIPLLTSSLTTSAAFLPIYLAEAAVGEYTAALFKVVTITLLCSWVLALTMIPMLTFYFMKVKTTTADRYDGRFYHGYRRLLLAQLRRPVVTMLAVLVVFIVAMQGFRFIPNIFFPPNDRPTFTAELELPIGTPIERTGDVARQIEQYIADTLTATDPDAETMASGGGVLNWGVFIGQGAPILLRLHDAARRHLAGRNRRQ